MVGFELLSQVQRDLTAEQAAQRLREMDKNVHYSQIKWSQKSHPFLVSVWGKKTFFVKIVIPTIPIIKRSNNMVFFII